MKVSLESLNSKCIYLLFFLIGFNNFILYVPATAGYLLFFNKHWQIKRDFLLFTTLNVSAIIFIFLLGYVRMTPEEPLKLFIVFLFVLLISGFLIQNQSKEIQRKVLACYILGYGFKSLIIAGYSYIFNDGSYGYGNIYDPFSRKEINSPGISNNLSILASLLIFYIFNNKVFAVKTSSAILLFLTLGMGIFLGGRTFFIIILFATFYSIIRPLTTNKIILILFLTALIYVVANAYGDFINTDFILKRFEKGLESKRFLHYQHGLSEFFKHPLGGYSVDQSIENVRWFHNIFLDMGRLGGWIPVTLFSLSLIYVALKSCKKNSLCRYPL